MKELDYEKFRLIVFDLDETIWRAFPDFCAAMEPPYRLEGLRLFDGRGCHLTLMPDARGTLEELASRGYRLSAASRNLPDVGRRVLEAFGLWDFFTHPCLEWQDKDISLKKVLQDFRDKGPEPYDPSETLFIDDWPTNIDAADEVGVAGLVFAWDIHELSELLHLLPEKAPAKQ